MRISFAAVPLLASVACATSTARSGDLGVDSGTTSHDSGASHDAESNPEADAGQQAVPDGEASDVVTGGTGDTETGTGGTSCSSLPLCDNFDSDTPDMPPAGWTVAMGCNPQTTSNPSGMADGPVPGGSGIYVGVDTSEHHSGNNSLRVVGGDSCGYYAVNTAAFTGSKLGPQYYARFWAMYSMAPTPTHNGFLSMNTTSTASHDPDLLRLGFQNNVIEWNWYGTDATLPDTDSQGAMQSVAPTASTWACIEFHIDSTTGDIEFWYNGASTTTPGLSNSGTASNGYNNAWINGGWKAGISPTSLGLGWGSFNGAMMTVWFDDVALGNSRIGCD